MRKWARLQPLAGRAPHVEVEPGFPQSPGGMLKTLRRSSGWEAGGVEHRGGIRALRWGGLGF